MQTSKKITKEKTYIVRKKQTDLEDLILNIDDSSEILKEFDFDSWLWKPKYALIFDVTQLLKTKEFDHIDEIKHAINEWSIECCQKRWYHHRQYWLFEDINDAMAFKLRWF